jgi:hypothetical protein
MDNMARIEIGIEPYNRGKETLDLSKRLNPQRYNKNVALYSLTFG